MWNIISGLTSSSRHLKLQYCNVHKLTSIDQLLVCKALSCLHLIMDIYMSYVRINVYWNGKWVGLFVCKWGFPLHMFRSEREEHFQTLFIYHFAFNLGNHELKWMIINGLFISGQFWRLLQHTMIIVEMAKYLLIAIIRNGFFPKLPLSSPDCDNVM